MLKNVQKYIILHILTILASVGDRPVAIVTLSLRKLYTCVVF
jgi:hypothetical protein